MTVTAKPSAALLIASFILATLAPASAAPYRSVKKPQVTSTQSKTSSLPSKTKLGDKKNTASKLTMEAPVKRLAAKNSPRVALAKYGLQKVKVWQRIGTAAYVTSAVMATYIMVSQVFEAMAPNTELLESVLRLTVIGGVAVLFSSASKLYGQFREGLKLETKELNALLPNGEGASL